MPYGTGKGEQVFKSVKKTIKRLLPSNIKVQVFLLTTNLLHVSVLRTKLNLSTDM